MALNVPKDNGKVTGSGSDQGKGTLTVPQNNGDLIRDYGSTKESVGGFTFDNANVRGEDVGDLKRNDSEGFAAGAPVWVEGRGYSADDTNSLGGFGDEAKSDPMFDKFKHEMNSMSDIDANLGSGSEAPEGVSSTGLVEGGAKSDPQAQELADEQQLGAGALKSQADKD